MLRRLGKQVDGWWQWVMNARSRRNEVSGTDDKKLASDSSTCHAAVIRWMDLFGGRSSVWLMPFARWRCMRLLIAPGYRHENPTAAENLLVLSGYRSLFRLLFYLLYVHWSSDVQPRSCTVEYVRSDLKVVDDSKRHHRHTRLGEDDSGEAS